MRPRQTDEIGAAPRERQQLAGRASETGNDTAAADNSHHDPPASEPLGHVAAVEEIDLDDPVVSVPAKADGPERFLVRKVRPTFSLVFRTLDMDVYADDIAHAHVDTVPRTGDSVFISNGFYKIEDIIWSLDDESHMSATAIVRAQPWPTAPTR